MRLEGQPRHRRTLNLASLAALLAALLLSILPAAANWRDDLKVVRVGFIAGDNPGAAIARMEPFRWQLQLNLAIPVELFPARSYAALIDAEESGRIQYAILSSLAFVALDQRCGCVEPVAQPTTADHQRGFHAFLVARNDGPIKTLADAKGMRLAVGAKDSLSGRLAPLAGIEAAGIVPDEYFARIIETDDSNAALAELASGDADLAVAWSLAPDLMSTEPGVGPLADLAQSVTLSPADIHIVWQSDLIPFGPHAIRKDLPVEAKTAISQMLLQLDQTAPEAYDAVEQGLPGGFVAADPSLYKRFSNILAAVAPQP